MYLPFLSEIYLPHWYIVKAVFTWLKLCDLASDFTTLIFASLLRLASDSLTCSSDDRLLFRLSISKLFLFSLLALKRSLSNEVKDLEIEIVFEMFISLPDCIAQSVIDDVLIYLIILSTDLKRLSANLVFKSVVLGKDHVLACMVFFFI